MSEKITLTRYLKGRGEVKALTHIEALAFGVPYPLQPGWPAKYGETEITEAMIEDLKARIRTAKQSTASKARRGLDGLAGMPNETTLATASVVAQAQPAAAPQRATPMPTVKASPVPGFVLRRPKRHRARKPALRT